MTSSLTPEQADKAKLDALNKFMKKATKDYDTNVAPLSSNQKVDVDVIPTGAISLDYILGVGGIPRGRLTEIYGPSQGGKTTLALEIAAQCQAMGGIVGFIDAEHALNRQLTEAIGVDPDRFVVAQPDYGEQAADLARDMANSGVFDMIIIDSAASMTPKAEIEAESEQQFMGLQARLLSRFCRTIISPIAENNVALVVLNQVRRDLGSYGAPERAAGGSGLGFYAALRVEVRTSNSKQIKVGSEVIGTTVTAKVTKSKLSSPFRVCHYDVRWGKGIDATAGIIEVAQGLGIIERVNNTYWLRERGVNLDKVEEKLAVGQPKLMAALEDDEALFTDVEAAVKAKLHVDTRPVDNEAADQSTGAEEGTASTPPTSTVTDANEDDFFGLGSD